MSSATGVRERGARAAGAPVPPNVVVSVVCLVMVLLGLGSAGAAAEPPVLLGIYTNGGFFGAGGAQEVQEINGWIADPTKRISIVGTFIDIERPNPGSPAWSVPTELEDIWQGGAVPFVNLMVGRVTPTRTAAAVAQGVIDAQITAWADAFGAWATGVAPGTSGPRRAFIAPFQEMNGAWVSYGEDPANFKRAYKRVQQIFQERGVPADSVRWVFAPNGASEPGHEFELYYPGNAAVDVVSFSAYNYGACSPWSVWDTFARAMKPFLDRMRVMAPSKPIFIAETGTVAQGGDKNAWLDETFTQLAAYPALRAVLYFHRRTHEGLLCDPVEYRFFAPADGIEFPGLRTALLRPAAGFGHWAPPAPEWASIAFVPGPGGNRFEDVEPAHPFAGVDTIWYYDAVEALAASGVTGGCSTAPPLYCPGAPVTREQMAVFLLKAEEGASFVPPGCVSTPFSDVPCSSLFAPWIRELVTRGITAGCGGGNYCPTSPVTREQMAVFLLKAKEGAGFVPPPCVMPPFGDVPCSSLFAPWIQELVARGITAGCAAAAYCPGNPVTRAQMALFLVKTFNLAP